MPWLNYVYESLKRGHGDPTTPSEPERALQTEMTTIRQVLETADGIARNIESHKSALINILTDYETLGTAEDEIARSI